MSQRTRDDYGHDLAEAINAPHCDRNAWVWASWMQAEGGAAKFNPLNTIQKMPGSTNYNDLGGGMGVQNYVSWDQGIEATSKVLLQKDPSLGFDLIVARLRRCARAGATLLAVENSDWGTGGLALRCLPMVRADYQRFGSMRIAGA